jgi:uncharacterized membrane protein
MGEKKLINESQQKAIQAAIAEAELNTSGEIRVHVDATCAGNPMEKAIQIFEQLKMHETAQRNGVLFYVAMNDKKLAILGDKGINAVVPENFWDAIRDGMISAFKKGEFSEGLIEGIVTAGQQLKSAFPLLQNDENELSNEVTFGDEA